MRRKQLFLSSAVLAFTGCVVAYDGFLCRTHCWEYRVAKADIEDDNEDGHFDLLCIDANNPSMEIDAPIPVTGVPGRACIPHPTQADHETIKAVIEAKQLNDLQSLTQGQIDTYEAFIEEIVARVRQVCIDRLTCSGVFLGCDIDPSVSGNQVCSTSSAAFLCDQYVKPVAQAALDLYMGPGVPTYAVPGGEWVPDDGGPCDFVPEGTAGHETGGGSSHEGPFGDIGTLVDCSPQTECTVSQELIDNVKTNADVFASEGVTLTHGSWVEGTGLRVSGLSSGDDAKELADAFDLRNNDVIAEINRVALTSETNVVAALNAVASMHHSGYIEFLVKRRASSDLLYKISIGE